MKINSKHLIFIVFPISLLAACGDAAPPQMSGGGAAPEVKVVTLETRETALRRELPGRTRAYIVAEVRPQVTGIVRERLFAEGERVEAGQVLYQLDDATYRADLHSARAALARAEAAREQARLQAKRIAEMHARDLLSAQDNDNAIAALRVAEADVGIARAAVERNEVMLGYTRITSPVTGIIGRSSVTPGALVTANQEAALATVQQLDPMYVDLNQSSSELLRLRQAFADGAARVAGNAPVRIRLEDGSTYAQPGELVFADVAVDPTTGSFALRVTVPNPDHLLMPGMYVRAVVENAVLEAALLVPQQAVTRDPKGNATAMVVTAEGTAELREIEVARTIGDQWLVTAGLQAGDRVIVEGLQRVRPGMPVTVADQ